MIEIFLLFMSEWSAPVWSSQKSVENTPDSSLLYSLFPWPLLGLINMLMGGEAGVRNEELWVGVQAPHSEALWP